MQQPQVTPDHSTPLAFLRELGPGGLQTRWEQLRQLVRDHGVNYSAPGELQTADRPWQLDLLPAQFEIGEFRLLSQGLAQRARLLEAILADLHGPQRLLQEGHLPARLVLGNPCFLRSCFGLGLSRMLHFYAADLVRGEDRKLYLLRDRTQAPTGAGYTLENRLLVSQVLEEPFRQGNVLRLASFFRSLRESLAALCPVARENPAIVLLSSGPYSPTYFEQTFLAQYLGYPLVEGGDLTVRDRKVFLKTLGGLSQVDVIFRHPEDDYCDPLELRSDSSLGVPGLVEAIRAKHVAVVNALGTGLLQSPAFLPFLPRLCTLLLGEDLALLSAEAYWCGDPAALSHVLAHLDRMVIRGAWPGILPTALMGHAISAAEREQLRRRLCAQPELFIAQAWVSPALEPVFTEQAFQPRPVVFRGYALCSGSDYAVLPGGLVLAGGHPNEAHIAVSRGAFAKDLWVENDGPVGQFSLLPPATQSVELSRGGTDLPSRSADNLFWLGRYTERAESMARLARHLLRRLADEGTGSSSQALPILFDVLAKSVECAGPPPAQPLLWLSHALGSTEPPGSLANTLAAALRSAVSVRDRLSSDTFRILRSLGDDGVAFTSMGETAASLTVHLDRLVTGLSAFAGLSMESMTRGHGWRFLDMGRRLERALQLLSLLRAAFAAGAERESALLETLLSVADSSITYRRRYLSGLHPAAVVDLLLVDDGNPRAVLFQIAALREHLQHLPKDNSQARLRPEERLALGALARLQLLDVVPACQAPEMGRPPLHRILGEVENDLASLSDYLCGGYLSHALVARPLAEDPHRGGTK